MASHANEEVEWLRTNIWTPLPEIQGEEEKYIRPVIVDLNHQ